MMRMFDRFRNGQAEPLRVDFQRDVPAPVGLVTAATAVIKARDLIAQVDPHAYPVFMTAGIDELGRSEYWEIGFDSRTLVANLWVEFAPDHATLRGVPHISHQPGSFMPELWAGMNNTQRAVFAEKWFEYSELHTFVDSDVAVARILAEHGDINLTSGSTTVSLAADRADELWALSVGADQWWTRLF